jgi:hypothetical protein
VGLEPDELFSVVPVWPNFKGSGDEFARAVAQGSFQSTYGRATSYKIEQFHLANLPNPVPASAYYAAMFDYWEPNGYSTIIDDTYNPYLAMKQRVLSRVDPAWASCKQGIQGMLDPPVVLSAVGSLAVPAMPPTNLLDPVVSAAPASVASSPWPHETALPKTGRSSRTLSKPSFSILSGLIEQKQHSDSLGVLYLVLPCLLLTLHLLPL